MQRLGARFSAAWFVTVISTSALAQEQLPGIKRLDDITRAKALAALAALIILGFAMILLTWLGARITQRYRNSSAFFKPTTRPGEHEWSRKPLGEADTKGDE
jgi:hypothetical protein